MAIKPTFEKEDEWEDFLDKTNPTKRLHRHFKGYSWSFGRDEDDEGFTRDCVILEVTIPRDTEPRQVKAKLTTSHLTLTVQQQELINEDFADTRWLGLDDSYWELATETDKAGVRKKLLKYYLYVRQDCPKYITGALFEKERSELGLENESDDDTVDTRIRTIANLKEPEPRRDDDVYFSEEEEFSDFECEGCGSRSVQCMKKADDREFKIYCNDCPYVSVANLCKEAPSIRRQREIDEAREKKRKDKELKKKKEKLALEDEVPLDLTELQEVD